MSLGQPDVLTEQQQLEVDAATFRRLLEHLDGRKDAQNIDLMNLAGFCRNCLSKWYRAAAEDVGVDVSDAAARERVYGMSYPEWKERFQQPASAEQVATFKSSNR